jgi:hypothetical protein
MNDIDFLPIEYRQRYQRRQSQPWQIIVAAAVLGLVVLAAVAQRFQISRARAELAAIVPTYDAAVEVQKRLGEARKRLEVERAAAELYVYLRHPWPRSQLLSALVKNLPRDISFQQVQILRESLPLSAGHVKPNTDGRSEEERLKALSPAQRDLEKLHARTDHTRTVVVLSGTAQEAPALHHYLGELDATDIFDNAELDSLSSMNDKSDGEAVLFRAVLAVLPGYGQPGGPQPTENLARANTPNTTSGANP